MQRLHCLLVLLGLALPLWAMPAEAAPGDVHLRRLKSDGEVIRAPYLDKSGDVALTLDPELQGQMERILKASRAPSGALVLSDAKTGRILAWVTQGENADLVRGARYPGASIYKVVTAATLLEGGHTFRGTKHCYGGGVSGLSASDVEKLCRAGEAKMAFGQALGHSINVIFGRLAVAYLKPEDLNAMGSQLGFGGAVPIDVPVEKVSIDVPAEPLGLARTAAGFGRQGVSPLAALFMMQTIANGGERVAFQIKGPPEKITRRVDGRAMKESTANALVRMLEVTTTRGTSREAFRDQAGKKSYQVAGKTGTLVVGKPARMVSWFAGFAPSRDPEVVVSVMLANDLKWWRKGNEVARDALDAYFAQMEKRAKRE